MRARDLVKKYRGPMPRGSVVRVGDRLRIDGLPLIAEYLKLSLQQTRRLYQSTVPEEHRLPVFTLNPGAGKNGRLSMWVDEANAWLDRRADRQFREGRF